jgi:hypothetical protein
MSSGLGVGLGKRVPESLRPLSSLAGGAGKTHRIYLMPSGPVIFLGRVTPIGIMGVDNCRAWGDPESAS